MPKIIEYPNASFSKSLEMATAIEYLGGSCTVQSCADRMGLKVSGAFSSIIGAAKKFDLIDTVNKSLTTTELFKKIKLAYDDSEELENTRISFFSPPLFTKIYEKFKGKELPIEMLPKLLIREYGVDSDSATRVSNYFIDGAKTCKVLIDNKLIDFNAPPVDIQEERYEVIESIQEYIPAVKNDSKNISQSFTENSMSSFTADAFVVHIQGPGINSKLAIAEEEDFIILEAMISKLKKKMQN